MATTTLKILREVKGYTQQQIADMLGIAQNTYSRLERQPKNLTGEQIQQLAEFYDVSAEDLLSEASPTLVFNNNNIESSNNGIVENVENDNRLSSNSSEVKSLKEEIEYLRKQNTDLIKALGSR